MKRPAALCCLLSGGASSSASAPTPGARDGRGTVRRLLALYARWGRELLLVVCLTLLSTGAALAVPYLLGRAVDCFLPWGGVERAALSVLLPTLAGAAAAQWLGNWGRRRWMEILSQRMVARIRRECFAKLGRLPLSYFDRHPHGDTMNRLVSDADNVSTVAAETVTQLLSSLLMVAGALAIMAGPHPRLHGGPQPAAHPDGPGNCAGDRPVHPPDLPAEQDALPPAGR